MFLNVTARRRNDGEVRNMDEINVYAYTSGTHQFKHKHIAGCFLVECIKDGNLYTYPPEGRDTFEIWEDATPQRATAYLLTRAVNIVEYYLNLTEGVKTVMIYLQDCASRPFKNDWPHKWEMSGYVNAHGDPVKDRDLWEQYNTHMHKLDGINIGFTTMPGSYQALMMSQLNKKLKEIG